MISDNLTIVIPTRNNSDEVISLLTQLSEQTDISDTRVILSDHSEDFGKLEILMLQHKDEFDFNIEITEGAENAYKSVNLALGSIATPYFLSLTGGVKFQSNQTIYNCLVELKSSSSKIIIPKIEFQSGGFVNSLIKMKFKATLKSHPFSPLSFFFAETEHIKTVGGFTTYQKEIHEEISICDSFNEDDIYTSSELIVIPNDMEVVNGYLKRIKEMQNVKEN